MSTDDQTKPEGPAQESVPKLPAENPNVPEDVQERERAIFEENSKLHVDPTPEDIALGFKSPPIVEGSRIVHMPSVISDMYGISRSEARMALGTGTVEVDGELWTGDKFDFPRDAIEGKRIAVSGNLKSFNFTYSK